MLISGLLLEVLELIRERHELEVELALALCVRVHVFDHGANLIILLLEPICPLLRLLDSLPGPVHLRFMFLLLVKESSSSIALILSLPMQPQHRVCLRFSFDELRMVGLQLILPNSTSKYLRRSMRLIHRALAWLLCGWLRVLLLLSLVYDGLVRSPRW